VGAGPRDGGIGKVVDRVARVLKACLLEPAERNI